MKAKCHTKIGVITKKFTLIELLVVLSIIGVLVALLSPALSKSRTRAKYTRWLAFTNNLLSDPSLIGQWTFPETMQSVVMNNAQGLNEERYNSKLYNGKLNGIGISKRDGRFGKGAAYFYGASSSFIEVDDNSLFYAQGKNLTAIVWFKPKDYSQRILVAKGNSTRRRPGWSIFLRGRKVIFRYSSDAHRGIVSKVRSSEKYPLNQWCMAAIVIDNQKNTLTGFFNGKSETVNLRLPRHEEAPVFKIEPMYFGKRGRGGRYYSGFIDEIEIFRRDLAERELKSFYEMGLE